MPVDVVEVVLLHYTPYTVDFQPTPQPSLELLVHEEDVVDSGS